MEFFFSFLDLRNSLINSIRKGLIEILLRLQTFQIIQNLFKDKTYEKTATSDMNNLINVFINNWNHAQENPLYLKDPKIMEEMNFKGFYDSEIYLSPFVKI